MRPKIGKNSLFFAFSLTVIFIIIFLVLLLLYSAYQEHNIVENRMMLAQDETFNITMQKTFIVKEFESITSDLIYLSKSPVFQNFINKKSSKNNVENEWIVFSNIKKKYDQLRYIDISGNEIIRINFNNGKAYKVGNGSLQNKKNRYYVTETLKLHEGQIYISKFDLNIEGNKLELPLKPMIRFGSPIFDQTKTKRGIIIVNYLGQYIIDEIKKARSKNISYTHLVNQDSYWLVGPDAAKDWAFMYPHKIDQKFKNQFPEEWRRISKEKNGQFFSSRGLFTFSPIYTADILQSILNKKSIPMDVKSCDPVWFIISQVPVDKLYYANDKSSYLLSLINILESPFLFLSLVIIALFFSVLSVLYISGIKKIKRLATYDQMTGAYNRETGINAIKKMIKCNNKIAICFVDINGLKEVNDFLGHAYGDDLIISSINIIKDNIRKNDLLIRLGGDEFLICFLNVTVQEAEEMWQRIVDKIQIINKEGDKKFIISLSHGIEELNDFDDYKLDDIIKKADSKMYKEKNIIKAPKLSVIK